MTVASSSSEKGKVAKVLSAAGKILDCVLSTQYRTSVATCTRRKIVRTTKARIEHATDERFSALLTWLELSFDRESAKPLPGA